MTESQKLGNKKTKVAFPKVSLGNATFVFMSKVISQLLYVKARLGLTCLIANNLYFFSQPKNACE